MVPAGTEALAADAPRIHEMLSELCPLGLLLSSQRQIVDDLQQLSVRPAPMAGEVA